VGEEFNKKEVFFFSLFSSSADDGKISSDLLKKKEKIK
jgi:hypothetical protein